MRYALLALLALAACNTEADKTKALSTDDVKAIDALSEAVEKVVIAEDIAALSAMLPDPFINTAINGGEQMSLADGMAMLKKRFDRCDFAAGDKVFAGWMDMSKLQRSMGKVKWDRRGDRMISFPWNPAGRTAVEACDDGHAGFFFTARARKTDGKWHLIGFRAGS